MKGRVVIIALLAYGGMMLILSATRSFVAAGVVLSLMGFCQAMYFAFNHSIVQLIAPSEIRGRVMSIWMISWGLTPVGLMPISAVADRLGTPLAFALAGSLSLVLVLSIAVSSPGLWNLQSDTAAE
jgi:sugar phosphate permease